MRILWHGVGPWHKTGYGTQTALFAPLLAQLGHEVAIAFMGRKGLDDDPEKAHPDAREPLKAGHWHGHALCGPGKTEFGLPAPAEIQAAFGGHEPDLVLVLKDAWILNADGYKPYNTAVWTAFDTDDRLGTPDLSFFRRSGARPIAVSLHGRSKMREAGLDPLYVPSGIDCGFWAPGDRAAARELLGLPPGVFIAGINSANVGTVSRKAFAEQFAGFAAFHAKHPRSLLLCHTVPQHPDGIDLRALAVNLGITGSVLFGSHVNMKAEQMRSWYRSLDVLLNATMGEGFGLTVVEAMACGIPAIGTRAAALPEKITPGLGWLVAGQKWWNPHHLAWWITPSIPGIAAALEKATRTRISPALLTSAVSVYDAHAVTTQHWKPVLERLEHGD